jgi:hypothetical protein
MQRLMVLFTGCVVLLIASACGGDFRASFDNRSQTEIYRDEVERTLTPVEGPFQTLEVYDSLRMNYHSQIVVCYVFTQVPSPSAPVEQGVGVVTFEQDGVNHYFVVNNHSIKTQQPPPLVMYDRYQHIDGLIVYGRILSAEVVAVNVTFDTGKTVRAVPQAGGFVVRELANEVRDLQVLGTDDRVLQQYNQPSVVTQKP